ncbi:MAG: toll/interleukin-1 receptor domain-containing protein [Candidatus Sabulitectum sp.]|nr:toll/interleukin-1 receptor domain-containing protein [Candidatus Sabulitectum sp.]
MKKYIFITHSSHDAAKAQEIRDYLETNGIQCWMAPRDIPVGAEWAEAILSGIENASGMLLIFSSNSNDSSQVRREIERAIHNDLPVFPVRIENVVPSKAMEYYISSNHWMDAFGGNFEANLSKLVTAIKNKHNITQENESETNSEPAQMKEPGSSFSSQTNIEPSKRKLTLPRLSFKIPKKILLPMAFLLLLVVGYFISRSFESSTHDTTTAEVLTSLPADTINTFIRMIASTDDCNDYVTGIKVTEGGNYVIMGYSYVNDDYEGKPWIAMFDSLGNEMWKHEGSVLGGEGEFDIYPDGRSVWAYPLIDTTLVNNSGPTLYTKEYIADNGEVVLSETFLIENTSEFFGKKVNLHTYTKVKILQVHIFAGRVFIRGISFFGIEYSFDEEKDLYIIGEGGSSGLAGSTANVFTIEFVLNEDSFVEHHIEIEYSAIYPFVSNIEFDDERIYSISLDVFQTPYYITFNSQLRQAESGDRLLSEESKSNTYSIFQNSTYCYLENHPILVSNRSDEFFLISLFPDNNYHCIKVDKNGNEIWYEQFGAAANDDKLCGAVFIEDALFLYGQTYSIETDNYDGYLLKINQEGEVLWAHKYNFGSDESISGVAATADGGMAMVFESRVRGTSDVFLVKVDSHGNMPQYNVSNNTIFQENWSSADEIQDNWFSRGRGGGDWNTSSNIEYGEDSYLNLRNDIAVYRRPLNSILALSLSAKMGASGYTIRGRNHYLRLGVVGGDEEISGRRLSLGHNPENRTEFKSLYRYKNDAEVYYENSAWFHWDYGENASFESCGRIGAGYFNGDSIVVGRIEPDTAWVEYSVLNDFEIWIDNSTADFYINDSLFFHTDEFVCESDSLYLYLGGASNTIPNAIGEVRVTSE